MTHYSLNPKNHNQHLIEARYEFTAPKDNPKVWLPTWIPGSYLIREFARHIGRVSASVSSSNDKTDKPAQAGKQKEHICTKKNKNTWVVSAKKGDTVSLSYEVYCFDLSVRGSYVDQTRIYGNFACLCLVAEGLEDSEITLKLSIPNHFKKAGLACSLPTKKLKLSYKLQATSYSHLIDHPFELAEQTRFGFEAAGIPHTFALSGQHRANLVRLKGDLIKICRTQIAMFGDAPFSDYLFMTMATGSDYGGLEHSNCTSLITPRDDLPSSKEPKEPSVNYRRFLGLCSHEYFHAWLVKTIRPKPMLAPSLHREVYTDLLWVFEGFTSYYDDLVLYRSGVISAYSYLKLLTEQINRYLQTHGRAHQSVAESSFDAWIKLYRSDENTANAGISYYNKGALVALCLDLTLKQHGARLDDVVRAMYAEAKRGKGLTNKRLDGIITQHLPKADWQDFKTRYITGVDELPIIALLKENGLDVKTTHKPWPLGLVVASEQGELKVKRVLRDSIAASAGISAGDTLVAIDNLKATESALKRYAHFEQDATCHFWRRDELMQCRLTTGASKVASVALSISEHEDAKKKCLAWLDTRA